MSQVQNLNQFRQTQMVGAQDQTLNNNIKVARINPAYVVATYPLVAGQVMKLVDVAGETLIVEPAAITETGYGVILHTLKKDSFLPGDYIDLACQGSVIYLETSAAVARGAKVSNTPTGPTVATLTTLPTNTSIGLMFDKAPAAGVYRVELNFQDPNQSAY